MYGIRQGKSAKQMIVDAIRKSTTSQKKVNEARWMWGNLDWNHHDWRENAPAHYAVWYTHLW
jgi:hypothetical protein